jgi:uncharacterized protein YjiS (DUF1127 family)
MSRTPMHNRFAEGFVESHSWGDAIDGLSSRVLPGHAVGTADDVRRRARAARDAALAAAVAAGWTMLGRGVTGLGRSLRVRFADWRERQHAAAELYALDDRSLAELGIHRAEIPFVVARPVEARGPYRAPLADRPKPANQNDDHQHAA